MTTCSMDEAVSHEANDAFERLTTIYFFNTTRIIFII